MPKCYVADCNKNAPYGYITATNVRYCNVHRPKGTVDMQRKCITPGCKRNACFGIRGSGGHASYCRIHKPEGYFDVKNHICGAEDCEKQAAFGVAGTKRPLFCMAHKLAEHVNVVSNVCIAPGCKTQASYGVPGTKRTLYCGVHMPANCIMLNKKRRERGMHPSEKTQPVVVPELTLPPPQAPLPLPPPQDMLTMPPMIIEPMDI